MKSRIGLIERETVCETVVDVYSSNATGIVANDLSQCTTGFSARGSALVGGHFAYDHALGGEGRRNKRTAQ